MLSFLRNKVLPVKPSLIIKKLMYAISNASNVSSIEKPYPLIDPFKCFGTKRMANKMQYFLSKLEDCVLINKNNDKSNVSIL